MLTVVRFLCLAILLMMPSLAAAQSAPVVLKAPIALDGKGQIIRNTLIVVQGSKIVRLGGAVPPGVAVYDLTGLTVMPGLIDTHSHIYHHFYHDRYAGADEPAAHAMLSAVDNAVATLNAGFTTIQSPGAVEDKDLREAIARGLIPGPRILTSLEPLYDSSGPPDRIRQLVRERKQQGADFIKIFASASIREGGKQTMSDAQIQAACGEAKLQGLRVIVHAHSDSSARAAVLAGCTSIEHGAYLSDPVFDLMVQHGAYYDPNVGLVLQNYFDNKSKYLGIGNYDEAGFAFMQKGIAIVLDTFKRSLTHKGLKIVYGTDANAGAHGRNYEEFVRRVQAGGQDAMAAIVSATSLSAESLGLQNQIGTIAPGMEADIIATDGNPLQDATAVRRVLFVMKGGRVYENLARGSKASPAPQ